MAVLADRPERLHLRAAAAERLLGPACAPSPEGVEVTAISHHLHRKAGMVHLVHSVARGVLEQMAALQAQLQERVAEGLGLLRDLGAQARPVPY